MDLLRVFLSVGGALIAWIALLGLLRGLQYLDEELGIQPAILLLWLSSVMLAIWVGVRVFIWMGPMAGDKPRGPIDWKDPDTYRTGRLRRCHTMHECELCPYKIDDGAMYYERSGHRAHWRCVEGEIEKKVDDQLPL